MRTPPTRSRDPGGERSSLTWACAWTEREPRGLPRQLCVGGCGAVGDWDIAWISRGSFGEKTDSRNWEGGRVHDAREDSGTLCFEDAIPTRGCSRLGLARARAFQKVRQGILLSWHSGWSRGNSDQESKRERSHRDRLRGGIRNGAKCPRVYGPLGSADRRPVPNKIMTTLVSILSPNNRWALFHW